MSDTIVQSFRSQYVPSINQKQLNCGGLSCRICGGCRDWYQLRNSETIVKRTNANCNCEFLYHHNLVRRPSFCNHEYYPLHNLICMCQDNH